VAETERPVLPLRPTTPSIEKVNAASPGATSILTANSLPDSFLTDASLPNILTNGSEASSEPAEKKSDTISPGPAEAGTTRAETISAVWSDGATLTEDMTSENMVVLNLESIVVPPMTTAIGAFLTLLTTVSFLMHFTKLLMRLKTGLNPEPSPDFALMTDFFTVSAMSAEIMTEFTSLMAFSSSESLTVAEEAFSIKLFMAFKLHFPESAGIVKISSVPEGIDRATTAGSTTPTLPHRSFSIANTLLAVDKAFIFRPETLIFMPDEGAFVKETSAAAMAEENCPLPGIAPSGHEKTMQER
jgi:hypothetical protein